MAWQGMAAAALHVQRALVSRVETYLADPTTGIVATAAAFGVRWTDAVPLRLYDEPPAETLPFYRLGLLNLENPSGGKSREYGLDVTVDAYASPVMGRPAVLAMAAAVEQALLVTDDAEDDRWPPGELVVSSLSGVETATGIRIVDTRTISLALSMTEFAGRLVYTASLSLELDLWEPG